MADAVSERTDELEAGLDQFQQQVENRPRDEAAQDIGVTPPSEIPADPGIQAPPVNLQTPVLAEIDTAAKSYLPETPTAPPDWHAEIGNRDEFKKLPTDQKHEMLDNYSNHLRDYLFSQEGVGKDEQKQIQTRIDDFKDKAADQFDPKQNLLDATMNTIARSLRSTASGFAKAGPILGALAANNKSLNPDGEPLSLSEIMDTVKSDPVFKWAQDFSSPETLDKEFPVDKRREGNLAVKAAGTVAGFAPALTGPAAPIVFAAQALGDTVTEQYQDAVKSGLDPDEAADKALSSGLKSGGLQGMVWAVLPGPLRNAADKYIVDQFGKTAISRFLAGRAAQAGEGLVLGAASRISDNLATDKPLTKDVAAGAAGFGLLNLILPRGATEHEQKLRTNLEQAFKENAPEFNSIVKQAFQKSRADQALADDAEKNNLPRSGQALREKAGTERDQTIKEATDKFTSILQKTHETTTAADAVNKKQEELETEAAKSGVAHTGEETQIPEPPPGERVVAIQRPDGSTYTGTFGDKNWEVADRKVPAVGRLTNEGDWSHGMLGKGETIVEQTPNGEKDQAVGSLISGHNSIPLNKEGHETATDLAKAVGDTADTVFTSPVRRAQQTAAKIPGNAVERNGLTPLDVGDYEGSAEKGIFEKLVSKPDEKAPNGESVNDFIARAEPEIKTLAEKAVSDKKKVVAVTHSANMKVAEGWALNGKAVPKDLLNEKVPAPGEAIRISRDNGKWNVEAVSPNDERPGLHLMRHGETEWDKPISENQTKGGEKQNETRQSISRKQRQSSDQQATQVESGRDDQRPERIRTGQVTRPIDKGPNASVRTREESGTRHSSAGSSLSTPESGGGGKTSTPLSIAHTAKRDLNKQLSFPKGATAFRVVDAKGREYVRPISDLKGSNPMEGAGPFKSFEAGTIAKGNKFLPMKEPVTMKEAPPPLRAPFEENEEAKSQNPNSEQGHEQETVMRLQEMLEPGRYSKEAAKEGSASKPRDNAQETLESAGKQNSAGETPQRTTGPSLADSVNKVYNIAKSVLDGYGFASNTEARTYLFDKLRDKLQQNAQETGDPFKSRNQASGKDVDFGVTQFLSNRLTNFKDLAEYKLRAETPFHADEESEKLSVEETAAAKAPEEKPRITEQEISDAKARALSRFSKRIDVPLDAAPNATRAQIVQAASLASDDIFEQDTGHRPGLSDGRGAKGVVNTLRSDPKFVEAVRNRVVAETRQDIRAILGQDRETLKAVSELQENPDADRARTIGDSLLQKGVPLAHIVDLMPGSIKDEVASTHDKFDTGGGINSVMAKIAKLIPITTEGRMQKVLAEALSKTGDNLPVEVDPTLSTRGARGEYDYSGKIRISSNISDESARTTFVHEKIHAVLGTKADAYLRNDPRLSDADRKKFDEIETLRKTALNHESTPQEIKDAAKLQGQEQFDAFRKAQKDGKAQDQHYGLLNLQEFMAEAVSNPKFQAILSHIDAPDGTVRATKDFSVWGRVKDLFRQLVFNEGGANPNSILARAFDGTIDLLKSGSFEEQREGRLMSFDPARYELEKEKRFIDDFAAQKGFKDAEGMRASQPDLVDQAREEYRNSGGGQPLRAPLEEDARRQGGYLTEFAKQHGFESVNEMAIQDPATFNAAAEQYRAQHPQEEPQKLYAPLEEEKKHTLEEAAENLVKTVPKDQLPKFAAQVKAADIPADVKSRVYQTIAKAIVAGGDHAKGPMGLKSFLQEDVGGAVKKGLNIAKAGKDMMVNMFAPWTKASRENLDALFEAKGYKDEQVFKASAAMENQQAIFDKIPKEDQIAFVDRNKAGEKQPSPELQHVADTLRELDKHDFEEISKYKPDLPFLDNHERVLWKVIPGSPDALAGLKGDELAMAKMLLTKRPWQGSKGMLKQHTLDSMSEGIALGGVPVTYNPVKMQMLAHEDAMKFVAANRAWDGLKKTGAVEFVRKGDAPPLDFEKLNDQISKVYFPVEMRPLGSDRALFKGTTQPGEFYVQKGVARLLNNYLGRDHFRENSLGRGLIDLKNMTTAMELAVNPFHAFFESNETIGSSLGLAMAKISSGDFAGGFRDLVESPVSFVSTAKLGGSVIRFAKDPAGFEKAFPEASKWFTKNYPSADSMIKDLFSGGGKLEMHEDYRILAGEGFNKALQEGNYARALMKAVPALNREVMKPLFEKYIPRLKVGTFMKEYSFELDRRADDLASGKITRGELSRQTWNFIEDRFGELNWDNLFWDRTFKSGMQSLFRSVTWKLGNIRGFGKAGRDTVAELGINWWKEGRAPRLTMPMAWLVGMSVVTAVESSVMSKVTTGKYPWELAETAGDLVKNLVFPRIDEKDASQRVSTPTYWRDAVHLAHSPSDYIKSSMTGEVGRLLDTWNNKDFYGTEVYNPDDPLYKKGVDVLEHMVPLPFGIQSYFAARKSGETPWKSALGLGGFTKAPYYVSHTAAEQEASKLMQAKLPQGARTQAEHDKSVKERQAVAAIKRGETTLPAAVAEGMIDARRAKYAALKVKDTSLQYTTSKLGAADSFKVYEKANAAERKSLEQIVRRKIHNSKTLTYVEKKKLFDQINGLATK